MTALPLLPERPPESHKGDYGLALVVGGSRGMAGAVALAGMAALRGGAGLVRLAVPDVCLETVAGFEPSYMTLPLPCDRAGRISLGAKGRIVEMASSADVVACGPGLGRSAGLTALVSWLYRHLKQPMVLDADALNALASRPESLAEPGGPRILTPHPGEFSRLVRQRTDKAQQRDDLAVELAARCRVVVVLKGHRTLVTDGEIRWKNDTGNPGMATGGSGDVLTGLIAALACQRLSPVDAARLGVYLHGLAGDLAAAELGQEAMIAHDLIRFLPQAFQHDRPV
jgi:NAD(P)H-hydrate epimerase